MKTVHLIFNAHIDPVWLWPWSAGLDEILNTCESVCNLLDRHPDLVFTRGEAWVYEQIELISPRLFERIRQHIRAGRWEVVGGWYIQPDCNLPTRRGFERQIELGRDYFRTTFGRFPRIGYNVDSFGHAATLPDIMAAYGQRHYVMMRPQEHEMNLPSRVFRWRGPKGGEVVTFRIAAAYCTSRGLSGEHIEASMTDLPQGMDHTMCFVGVGDHGGGPTESLVEWCREHQHAFSGARLVFSCPSRFFRAIRRQVEVLPVVEGELQHHAIGCYSVHRRVKSDLRLAEDRLEQAERALAKDGALRRRMAPALERAWKWACFTAFHDTMGGTCLPSAYRPVEWQIGTAQATADEVLNLRLRRLMVALPQDPRQRIVIANWSGRDFEGYVEHEPWLEWTEWQKDWVLLDERNRVVPHQNIEPEAVRGKMTRLLFRMTVPRSGHRVLRVARNRLRSRHLISPSGISLNQTSRGEVQARGPDGPLVLPRLVMRRDSTDTWSHGVDRFAEREIGQMRWDKPRLIESGPLRHAWIVTGALGRSKMRAEWRFYQGEGFFDLILQVDWREEHRVLQLAYEPGGKVIHREDGIPGGTLRRDSDGRERPLMNFSRVQLSEGQVCGFASPDVYSVSSNYKQLVLTLLRSPLMAHHEPAPPRATRPIFSDRGMHSFRLRVFPGPAVSLDRLAGAAMELSNYLCVGDLTMGMPLRPLRDSVEGRV